jgi:exodeoxyribonuclease V beta subunit
VKPFDLVHTPLEGINLIEASAGTGKTYTIEGLFVRLIAEHRLPVDQILVVTFTKAATAELNDRIRRKLIQAKTALLRGVHNEPFLEQLVDKTTDPQRAADLIGEALANFDKAAIFTIHGFCQRLLYEYAFETGTSFDTELVADPRELVREVVDDFWRQHFYPAPVEFVGYCLEAQKTPDYFYRLLIRAGRPDVTVIPVADKPSTSALGAFRSSLEDFRSRWPESREAVIRCLNDPALNATIYGSLNPDTKLSGLSRRELRIRNLVAHVEAMANPNNTGFPLFPEFEKLTRSKLKASTRRNQTAPDHVFFDQCEDLYVNAAELTAEFENLLLFIKQELIRSGRAGLSIRKQLNNIQFFDDLLLLVQAALSSARADRLISCVRGNYQAALVDEFQDTDSVQYDIFSRLFAAPGSLLFMIGDPKQAIYGFRGADIFSYLKAAREIPRRFTLTTNYRSDAGLVEAVNAIFSKVQRPFVFGDIGFRKAQAARVATPEGQERSARLIVWYLDPAQYSAPNRPINKTDASRSIAQALGWEILRLLTHERSKREPQDIAVLVRTNRQADLIKQVLGRLRIPSVLYSTGDIFDTREALELQQILASIAEPNHIRRLKTALVTDMLGISGDELSGADENAHWWQDRMARTRHYHDLWSQHGFMRMFHQFLVDENIKQRLIRFEDGERRLTNVLHLAEILHQQSLATNFGLSGLLKWLAEQRAAPNRRFDEQLLRLESDEKAVKIVTIHKSKGLEYPVVFCPFGWESIDVNEGDFLFHDVDNDARLTLDLAAGADPRHLVLARNEQLAENLRLLYVALTRAKEACYLPWGRIKSADTSALAYLLHADFTDNLPEDLTADLKARFDAKTDAELISELNRLVRRSNGSIKVMPLPATPVEAVGPGQALQPSDLRCREFTATIDHSWRVSSYSSLLLQREAHPDRPDRDAMRAPPWISLDDEEPGTELQRPKHVFAFPKGTRTGLFFHDIFERVPFAVPQREARRLLIAAKLQAYGFESDWLEPVHTAIEDVLNARLRTERTELELSAVADDRRIHELEFYFPLAPVSPGTLQDAFGRSRHNCGYEEFPNRLESLEFAPARGFMKGFIDLIFQHQGVFYVVDWKSNYLGPDLSYYALDRLTAAMIEHYYFLQYLLYTLAVHQYLTLRMPRYRYEQHFGGVFYLFVRGVNTQTGSDFGIFHDRPDPDLIRSLGQALIPGFRDGDSI